MRPHLTGAPSPEYDIILILRPMYYYLVHDVVLVVVSSCRARHWCFGHHQNHDMIVISKIRSRSIRCLFNKELLK